MSLDEARAIVYADEKPPFAQLLLATGLIASSRERTTIIQDLVQCLRRGAEFHSKTGNVNAVQEQASLALYSLTARPRKLSSTPYEDFVTSASDWESYFNKCREG